MKKQADNLAELEQKAKQLVSAQKDVVKAQGSISDERTKLDNEIKAQIKERSAMQKLFDKKAAERQEAERLAAEARERQEEEERQIEKEQRMKALKQTEEIEEKARALHKKELELKKDRHLVKDSLVEVKEEIEKITAQIQETKDEEKEHLVRHRREMFRKEYEENREARGRAREAEEKRRKKLENSCKPSKVRTYACNKSGHRDIKYFNYYYDFDKEKCLEKVKKVKVRCKQEIVEDEEEPPRRKVKSRRRHGFIPADAFASHT